MAATKSSGSAEFDSLRDHLAANITVQREVENALAFLLARANPSDRAARFVVGGAVEWIVAAAAWSAGVLTNPAGHNANGFDLVDLLNNAKGLWSVKFSSDKRVRTFRLTNGLGGAGKGFVEPTIFIHNKLGGFVFIDPAKHPKVAAAEIKDGDAALMPFGAVATFAASHPECVAVAAIPMNEGQASSDPFGFVKELLAPEHFPNLSKVFLAAVPAPAAISDEIRKIVELFDSGLITADERQAAIARLLGS